MSTSSNEDLTAVHDQLRAEIREAHEALKDLRAAIKEARRMIPELVAARIEAEVAQQMEALGEATQKAMDAATDKVTREFDRLLDSVMGRSPSQRKRGREPLPELFRKAAEDATTCCDKPVGAICIHDRLPGPTGKER